jgi:DMSO/TMAO reductase YedYZ molybdopterin-dependent catalytic subunit
MSQSSSRELFVAVLGGVAAVAGSYVAAGYTPSFVVAPIDAQIVFWTPGAIVTYMIENVGEEAHLLHIGLAVAIAVGAFGALSFAGRRLGKYIEEPFVGGTLTGVGTWGLAMVLTGEPLLAIGPAIPIAVLTIATDLDRPMGEYEPSRRRTLGSAAAVAAFLGAGLLGDRFFRDDSPLPDAPNAEGSVERMEEAQRRSLDTAGSDLPGLVSSIEEFYNVDIAELDPDVPAEEWSLTVTGDVETELMVTYDEVIERDIENRLVTLRCVGEQLNGKKLDTAIWTGTPIRPLLESADPDGECDCAMLRGEDGYYVQFPIDVLAEGFLAWGMNGKELPTAHGHPVRVLIPGHWGETNVKWLTEIEMLEREADGYWEERGWQGTGPVKTVAKLWDEGITELDDGRVELAGHAYAGTRGIDSVEVSIDGGDTWNEAELSEPLPDEDVWRQWRYRFEPSGSHEAVVRATDGEGTQQIREESDPSPTGSSGWVSRTIET